ncbi:YheC/YheD family protein [Brevibacillus sp. B_LB10_24]|uniref:YheC/YheD family protein n=1 Tax=Brevibacillus sp. B_LB10_24 TaxID=3380645 RepID=UPI0038BD9975
MKYIRSKMLKGKPLMNDRVLSRHVPATRWYRDTTLIRMLRTFPVLYIKPDKGSLGTGIIRVKRLSRSKSLISINNWSKKCPSKSLVTEVKKRMLRGKKYLIQRGIPLATYHNKPFDLRVVLQKPSNRWVLTWMSAKVAPRARSVVTNVAKGARDARIMEVLRGADQSFHVSRVLKKLTVVSYKIAYKLGSRFPIRIVGLDMGIDKKGKVWFIEANTNPDFRGLKKLDPVQYRRYLRAKRQIEAKTRKKISPKRAIHTSPKKV